MKKTCLNKDNAVKLYLWVEMAALASIITIVSSYVNFLLIPLFGLLIAIKLKNDIKQFYRFVYSLVFSIYVLQICTYIKEQEYLFGVLGLTTTLAFFMMLRREELNGKTL